MVLQSGVRVDVLYLKINYIINYNLPFVQSDYKCNPGPTYFIGQNQKWSQWGWNRLTTGICTGVCTLYWSASRDSKALSWGQQFYCAPKWMEILY